MSSEISIHDIFQHDDKMMEIYRDVLLYHSVKFMQEIPKEAIYEDLGQLFEKLSEIGITTGRFRLTELGNWLIEYHRPFVEEFRGSHLPKSYRFHSKRNYIRRRVLDLVQLNFIEIQGTSRSEKNNSETPIYELTQKGVLAAWILYIIKQSSPVEDLSLSILFQYWINILYHINGSFHKFLMQFLYNCRERGLFENFVRMNGSTFLECLFRSNPHELREYLITFGSFEKELFNVFLQTVRTVNKETRKLVLFQLKLDIESEFVDDKTNISLEWELMRYQNIDNFRVLTLSGSCDQCNKSYPFTMDLLDFLKLSDLFAIDAVTHEFITQRTDCSKCGGKGTLNINPNWLTHKEHLVYLKTVDINVPTLVP